MCGIGCMHEAPTDEPTQVGGWVGPARGQPAAGWLQGDGLLSKDYAGSSPKEGGA